MTIASASELKRAERHLITHDLVLGAVIKRAGPCTITPHKDYYGALVNSIIGQQLSVKAAASIKQRFLGLFGNKFPTPAEILEKSVEELSSVGFSNAKANYMRDLAQHVIDGRVRFDKLDAQSNEEIITELTDVKGVGEWTAHMFLMFCMGRLDVLPVGDLGIRNGVGKLYSMKKAPTPEQVEKIAKKNKWHPYESVASWYVWRSLENKPAI